MRFYENPWRAFSFEEVNAMKSPAKPKVKNHLEIIRALLDNLGLRFTIKPLGANSFGMLESNLRVFMESLRQVYNEFGIGRYHFGDKRYLTEISFTSNSIHLVVGSSKYSFFAVPEFKTVKKREEIHLVSFEEKIGTVYLWRGKDGINIQRISSETKSEIFTIKRIEGLEKILRENFRFKGWQKVRHTVFSP